MNFFYISDAKLLSAHLQPSSATANEATAVPLSLTIGNFDGVHLGHQQLLKESKLWAKAHQGVSVVLTFEPHPALVLNPKISHARLFPLADQREQLQKQDVNGVVVQSFTEDFAQMSATDFLQNYIETCFHPQQIVVGYDFGFGRNREGNLQMLQAFCASRKIDLQIVKALKIDEEVVSSSAIRELVRAGNVKKANRYLGRAFYLQGEVVLGAQRGRLLGFPTANLLLSSEFVPKLGVYVSRVSRGESSYESVTNIGINPTVESDGVLRVESHLLNFSGDIYGHAIRVELLDYIREEKKFANLEELKMQIARDVQSAREWFS
jgi:riboflavin kinase/FMN adenylyltransferase